MNLRVFYLYKTVGFGWLPSFLMLSAVRYWNNENVQ